MAAAELAMVLPLLTFVVLAATDFARVFYYTVILANCARNGAMYASNPGTQSESAYGSVTAAAQAEVSGWSTLPTVATPTYSSTVNGTYSSTVISNGYVKVTVNWTFSPIIPYPGIPTMNLSRTVRMRMIP